jgi:hypothetical protein
MVDRDRKERLDLVEQEAAVAVGRGDQRIARIAGEGQRAPLDLLGPLDELGERSRSGASRPASAPPGRASAARASTAAGSARLTTRSSAG